MPLLLRFTEIAKIATVLVICSLIIPNAQAHEGHHNHQHALIKATGGNFTLTSANGSVSLSDFHGKVVAIYFGYSHCTDTCPLDLSNLGKALKSMNVEESAQIQPIFITLDPARDNAKHMASYSASFHPKLIGLTGTQSETDAVTKAYGVPYKKGTVRANGSYDFEHPSAIFIVGKNGELVRTLSLISNPKGIVSALRQTLNTKIS